MRLPPGTTMEDLYKMYEAEVDNGYALEARLIKALGPVRCPECFSIMKFNERGCLSDPGRVILFQCPGCNLAMSDFPDPICPGGATYSPNAQRFETRTDL